MVLSKVLEEEIQILISSGSHVLSERLTAAPGGLWGWRGMWWLSQVCLLQLGCNHAVVDCSVAMMSKSACEWEVAPQVLWSDVEMITRYALVHAAKEGQEFKGRNTPRSHVHWLEVGSTCAEAEGNSPSASNSGLEMANRGWLWLIMFSQCSVLRVKAPVACDHIVMFPKSVPFCTESWNVENFSFCQLGWGN